METNMTESCVPPGFRFHPTEEELVGYYLRKKVASQKIDLDVIRHIDLYRIEPWDLQEKCGIGCEVKEWYFFSQKDKKYPSGTKTNRATMAGFWKATGRDKPVYEGFKVIGMRKTLVFYKGRAPNGLKTDWIMHEYRLESPQHALPQEGAWVVCRAFKKRMTGKSKSTIIEELDDSTYYYDESTVIVDSTGYAKRGQKPPQDLLCKQEMKSSENLHLPQLESPTSHPLMTSSLHRSMEEQESIGNSKKVRDWRDLDKFVASQLSHGDYQYEETTSRSDLRTGSFLFQNGNEEATAPMLNELSTF